VRDPPRALAERDLQLLGLAAEHQFILAEHGAALLGVSPTAARRRLRRLTESRLLLEEQPVGAGRCYRIAGPGLRQLGSSLPRPRAVDGATFDHEVGLAWLWLAAHRGAFGPLREVVSERRMRSEDGRRGKLERAQGVRLPGSGPGGRERHHYPDLVLRTGSGHRVAVELELTGKSRARRREILGGYAFDSRVDAVLYLVDNASTGAALRGAARQAGIAHMVHVQPVRFGVGSGASGRRAGAGRASAGRAGAERSTAGRASAGRTTVGGAGPGTAAAPAAQTAEGPVR
jgi:hypothetical protein